MKTHRRRWLICSLSLILLGVALFILLSCESAVRIDPAQSQAERTVTEKYAAPEHDAAGQIVERTVTEKASGKGASLRASGDKATTSVDSTAPQVDLGGGGPSASGGDSGIKAKVESLGVNWLVIAGIACILGAGVAFYLRLRTACLVAAGLGIALIAIGLYPWLLLLIAPAGVIAVGFYVHSEWKAGRLKEAIVPIVDQIERSPQAVKDHLLPAIDGAMKDRGARRAVKSIRRKLV